MQIHYKNTHLQTEYGSATFGGHGPSEMLEAVSAILPCSCLPCSKEPDSKAKATIPPWWTDKQANLPHSGPHPHPTARAGTRAASPRSRSSLFSSCRRRPRHDPTIAAIEASVETSNEHDSHGQNGDEEQAKPETGSKKRASAPPKLEISIACDRLP